MSEHRNKTDYFMMGLEDLRQEGREGATVAEIALRACVHDEAYMKRRQIVNALLRPLGINRSEEPARAPWPSYGRAEASATISMLEQTGLVEFQMEYPLEAHETPQRLYRAIQEVESVEASPAVQAV